VVILDVKGLSSITDYYLVATGNNTPHLKALAESLERGMKALGSGKYRTAGTPESEWLVADYLDAVVHIFTPHMREYYDLERLWGDAKKVE